jgi:hypothetical protein
MGVTYFSGPHPVSGLRLGVIYTPCLPHKYYGGWIHNGEALSNSFIYYHKLYSEAWRACKILANEHKMEVFPPSQGIKE